jgi:putative intracellular protease/amidase
MLMRELDKFDALFIPGGPGNDNVDKFEGLDQIIEHFVKENKVVGAICAAPTLLAKRGYLDGKKAICFNDKNLRQIMIDNGAIIEHPSCD